MPTKKIGAVFSHVGKRRPNQEDCAGFNDEVFVVCDGMGGHAGGEVASQTCVESILAGPRDPVAAFLAAQQAIREKTEALDLAEAGTTCVALLGDKLLHAGDSRAYLLRAGHLTQVTRDHTLIQDAVDGGAITPEEARHHRMRHVLTRCMGYKDCTPDVIPLPLQAGDRLLLCTDGLYDGIDEADIAQVLGADGGPLWMAQQLGALALAGKASDNITALVVHAS